MRHERGYRIRPDYYEPKPADPDAFWSVVLVWLCLGTVLLVAICL